MSLILDALNKAERERDKKEPVPHLGTYHAAPKAVVSSIVPLWAIISIIALLVVVVLALSALFVRLTYSSGLQPQQTVSLHPEPSPAAEKAEDPPEKAEAPSQADQAQGAGLVIQPGKQPVVAQVDAITAVPEPRAFVEPVITPEIAAIYEQVNTVEIVEKPQPGLAVDALYGEREINEPEPPAKTKPSKKEESFVMSAEVQAMWNQVKQDVDSKTLTVPKSDYANIPYLRQLPESFQSRIPALMYQNHIYSPKGGAVIINGITYRQGDTIAADLVVEAITEEELVLSYLHKPFKLSALSSWVH